MSSSEEKIKAFFSDEKNIKALAKDEVFMSKISNGQATHKDYEIKFKELGIRLSNEEIEETRKMVSKLLNITAEKLSDYSLENVSGGMFSILGEVILYGVFYGGMAIGGTIGAAACGIASGVEFYKSNPEGGAALAGAAVVSAGIAAAGFVKLKKG